MKKLLVILAATILVALPLTAQYPTYVSQAGSTFFVGVAATATQTATIDIPSKSANGNLLVTTTGITGSPSGCTFAMYSLGANSSTAPAAAEQTPSVTITTGTHTQVVAALSASDITTDRIKLVYACSTYPTAGTITVSFSPSQTSVISNVGDPCLNPNVTKSSVTVSTSGAATTQLVALAAGKSVYVCSIAVGISATTATLALEYGTGSSCGTGTTALTGTIVPTAGMWLTLGWGGSITTAPSGNALCIVNGGTGTQIGLLTFVQQ